MKWLIKGEHCIIFMSCFIFRLTYGIYYLGSQSLIPVSRIKNIFHGAFLFEIRESPHFAFLVSLPLDVVKGCHTSVTSISVIVMFDNVVCVY